MLVSEAASAEELLPCLFDAMARRRQTARLAGRPHIFIFNGAPPPTPGARSRAFETMPFGSTANKPSYQHFRRPARAE